MNVFNRGARDAVLYWRRWWSPIGWLSLCESAAFAFFVSVLPPGERLDAAVLMVVTALVAGVCFVLASKCEEWKDDTPS
jgi:hypothetical protein